MKVIFYDVKKSLDKLIKLTHCAKIHFENQKPLVFFVPDSKAEQFVDHVLWQNAAFLPHATDEEETEDLIIISKQKEILTNAKYIFNLTPNPLNINDFKIIYEFDDKTDLKKKMLSKKKFNFYHDLKLQIEAK